MTPTLAPAEAIAASLCWLSRLRSAAAGPGVTSQVEGYWHNKACRFCKTERVALMGQIEASWLDPDFGAAVTAFDRLEKKVKVAKVREAQERAWYDELPPGDAP